MTRVIRRIRPLHLAPLLALLVLGAWVFASPLGSSPDDDYHLTSAWCADSPSADCEAGDNTAVRVAPEEVVEAGHCFRWDATDSAACQDQLLDGDVTADTVTTRGNFNPSYPPVYYSVMNVFVGDDVEAAALTMRFVSVAVFITLTSALFALLRPERRPMLLLAWVVTTMPLGLFLIASNNPSGWAVIGLGTVWISLLGFFESHGWRKVALGAITVIAAVMSAGSRGDAAMYTIIALGVGSVLGFARTRRYALGLILPGVLAALSVAFFLSARQVRSGISGFTGAVSAEAIVERHASVDKVQLAISNFLEVPSLWAGIFGGDYGLGWLDTKFPAIVTFAGILAFLVVIVAGLGRMTWRKGLMLLGLVAVLWLLPVWVLTQGAFPVGEQVQPRYLLPLIVVFAGVAAYGAGDLRLTRLQMWLLVGALSFAHAIALHNNMRRYISGDANFGWNLNTAVEWWWSFMPSPMIVLMVGALAYPLLLAMLMQAIARTSQAVAVTAAR
ncbi:DUF2142 domain-containing protein [Salinibacterium sp. GXW1014]|uniref:DUF2142 domain-containing protein n=1 Tax=Salinibacterium sp. GXW1014 TaxID=3377838 RepID=UPI003839F1D9